MIANRPTTVHAPDPGFVDSLLHPLAITIRQLLTRSGRQNLGRILIDDEENILQAMEAGVEIQEVCYSGSDALSNHLAGRLPVHTAVYEIAWRTCKKLFETDRISRVFAIARVPKPTGLESLVAASRDMIILEDLSISGNIGAIIRTSLAMDVGGIVLLNAHPLDMYDRRLIRASRGYVFSLPVVTASTEEFLNFCKQKNLPILVGSALGENLVHELGSLHKPLAIVLGSEKNGCSQAVAAAATLKIRIPMNSQVESLNVSAAAGIILYNRLGFNRIAYQARSSREQMESHYEPNVYSKATL